jgi:hypothetical protein
MAALINNFKAEFSNRMLPPITKTEKTKELCLKYGTDLKVYLMDLKAVAETRHQIIIQKIIRSLKISKKPLKIIKKSFMISATEIFKSLVVNQWFRIHPTTPL